MLRHHLFFWVAYMAWDIMQAVITFSDEGGVLSPKVSMAFFSTLLGTILKIVLAYYLLFFVLQPAIQLRKMNGKLYARGILSMAVALVLQRAIMFYLIVPKVYLVDNSKGRFFNTASFIVTFLDLILPVVLLLAYQLFINNLYARHRETRLEKEKLQSELNFLKAQINPHFLFNMLGSVHALTRIKAPDAAMVTIKLSKMMRYMLFDARERLVTIDEEVALLDNYIDLERVRFGSKLQLEFNRHIDKGTQKITPLILLPFVENAFKHGVADSRHKATVNINLTLNRQQLTFEIVNSLEQSSDSPEKHGIGLANVKRQLELIYPQHQLTIQTRNSEFFVLLKLNLSENDQTFLSGN